MAQAVSVDRSRSPDSPDNSTRRFCALSSLGRLSESSKARLHTKSLESLPVSERRPPRGTLLVVTTMRRSVFVVRLLFTNPVDRFRPTSELIAPQRLKSLARKNLLACDECLSNVDVGHFVDWASHVVSIKHDEVRQLPDFDRAFLLFGEHHERVVCCVETQRLFARNDLLRMQRSFGPSRLSRERDPHS